MLSTLAISKYAVKSTKDLIQKIKKLKIPNVYESVLFDVKSLFINVQETIGIILKRIYGNKEITTSTSKKDIRDMLVLCIKNVHFSRSGEIYFQIDNRAMGLPVDLLAGIFMVKLEQSLLSRLRIMLNSGSNM